MLAVPPLPAEQRVTSSPVQEATIRALELAEQADSVIGQIALTLARRLDSPGTDTGSSLAAISREYRSAMAEALEHGKRQMDPLQRIRMQMIEREHGTPAMVHGWRNEGDSF